MWHENPSDFSLAASLPPSPERAKGAASDLSHCSGLSGSCSSFNRAPFCLEQNQAGSLLPTARAPCPAQATTSCAFQAHGPLDASFPGTPHRGIEGCLRSAAAGRGGWGWPVAGSFIRLGYGASGKKLQPREEGRGISPNVDIRLTVKEGEGTGHSRVPQFKPSRNRGA